LLSRWHPLPSVCLFLGGTPFSHRNNTHSLLDIHTMKTYYNTLIRISEVVFTFPGYCVLHSWRPSFLIRNAHLRPASASMKGVMPDATKEYWGQKTPHPFQVVGSKMSVTLRDQNLSSVLFWSERLATGNVEKGHVYRTCSFLHYFSACDNHASCSIMSSGINLVCIHSMNVE
jgi:hypothetical protein